MALSEYRRHLIASALIASKLHLAADEHQLHSINKCQHICSALHRVNTVGAKMARDVIADRLIGKRDTVYQWLKRQGYSPTTDQIQAYRHRWLNALIEEFTAPVDPLLDPKNRRKVAHAFKRAKVKVRQHTFICLALERQDTEGAEMAKAIIQQRLGRSHYSLDAWVHQHIDAEACGSQVHQFRLRWLDALIEEFSR